MRPFAVITARAGSKRLPWKNMLPIGGMSLAQISIKHAIDAGLFAVVTSDIDVVLAHATKVGALPVRRPADFSQGNKHLESIRHAVESAIAVDPSKKGEPVVLLQPTSPFRNGDIIQKCIDAHRANPDRVVFSGRTIHYASPVGEPISTQVWDGCVAVYPQNAIGPSQNPIIVENEHGNMLQIDTESDYIQACIQHWRQIGCWAPLGASDKKAVAEAISPIVNGQRVTLVGRPDGKPIDQSRPVVWLNHCVGWDGGRADILVVVASKNLTKVGINKELDEVAAKASVVIIREFGQSEWVLSNLKTNGKVIVVKDAKYQVTTGAFASILVYIAGGRSDTVGFQRGISRIPYCFQCFPDACASEEIAMLEVSGSNRLI